MEEPKSILAIIVLFFCLLSGRAGTGIILGTASNATIGINYGQLGDNLPSPQRVARLLRSINIIKKVKLYDANREVLEAFANTGIEFVVGLSNEYVGNMTDQAAAVEWVKENVQGYLPGTNITCIAVGNEVFTNDTVLMANLVPAMQNIHSALVSLGLQGSVNVTTAHSSRVLSASYPPSAGAFKPELTAFLRPLLDFLSQTSSPFLINAYPYFAYKDDPDNIPLDYVLFQPNAGMVDAATNLHYGNMLHAQIDSVYSALSALGYPALEVKVSETGWPSKGDSDEVGATPENARIYNSNLLQLLAQNQGTPMRPSLRLETYVFALFNEDRKPGQTSERNYGLFKSDGSPAYDVGLHGSLSGGSSNTNSYNKVVVSSLCSFFLLFFL